MYSMSKTKSKPRTKRRSLRKSYKKKSPKSPSPKSPSNKCCMCEKNIKGKFLNPAKCLKEHGSISHKICEDCWWKKDGFATEGVNHSCPGCVKGMPLGKQIKQSVPKDALIIDLT